MIEVLEEKIALGDVGLTAGAALLPNALGQAGSTETAPTDEADSERDSSPDSLDRPTDAAPSDREEWFPETPQRERWPNGTYFGFSGGGFALFFEDFEFWYFMNFVDLERRG